MWHPKNVGSLDNSLRNFQPASLLGDLQNHEQGFPDLIGSNILAVVKHDPSQIPKRFRSAKVVLR